MTRGTVPGLRSAHPLADVLPGVYVEDPLAMGFTRGLDTVLAPVFLTLDSLEAYVSPRLAPEDFLPWLASWVGVTLADSWPLERKRQIVAEAVHRHRHCGTRDSLRTFVEALTGGQAEILDNGGTVWSDDPAVEPPGDAVPWLRVVVRVDDPDAVDPDLLRADIREVRPVHLPFTLDVRPRDG
jgi:phage tail-like protein